jgi:hypothetical protein
MYDDLESLVIEDFNVPGCILYRPAKASREAGQLIVL